MALNYKIHKKALSEIDAAIDYYNQKGGNKLASKFMKDYVALRTRILNTPLQFPVTDLPNIRKAIFPNFPYVIIFFPAKTRIFIIAIFHTSRNPESWASRIP